MRVSSLFYLIYLLFPYRFCIGDDEPDDDDCGINTNDGNMEGFIIGIVIVYTICLICAILIAIYLFKFYQNRDDPNIENRHPRLVYCTTLLVIFSNIVLFPLAIDYWTLECVTHTKWLRRVDTEPVPMEAFLIVSFVIVLLGWLNLVVLRVWLLRYDYAASLARKAQIWKKDLGIDGGTSTWWITHQQTWGKEAFLLKVAAIPYLISVILSVAIAPIYKHDLWEWTPITATVGTISIILCGFVVVNVWRVRSIHDNFHIKDEVLLFSKSSMIIAAILVIIYGISRVVDSVGQESVANYIVLIWGILVMFLLTTASLIQTAWVLYGIRRKNEKSEKLVKSINDEWESNVSLSTVLKSKEGFEVFMDFLVAEYSTENLLCYVEATQFLRKWKYVIYKMKGIIIESKKKLIKKKKKSMNNIHDDEHDNNNNNNDDDDDDEDAKMYDLRNKEDGDRLVNEATIYVHKQMDRDHSDSDQAIDSQPWAFHDKESILIKFKWVKLPPVMKEESITLWDHFRHLRQKYISATSAHQVNIRSALYKHYTKIKREDCDLSNLDISDVFTDPLHQQQQQQNGGLSPAMSPNSPSKDNTELSNTFTALNISDVEMDDHEGESLQPGQIKDTTKKPKKINSTSSQQQQIQHIELSQKGNESDRIRRSHTQQYNRNLRNLYGVAKVLQLIEDTRKELWKNMNDSFVRFRSTESYVNYIKKVYVDRKQDSLSNASNDNLYIGIDSD